MTFNVKKVAKFLAKPFLAELVVDNNPKKEAELCVNDFMPS